MKRLQYLNWFALCTLLIVLFGADTSCSGQCRTLGFENNNLAIGALSNTLALKDLPCSCAATDCHIMTIEKYNLVYKLKIVDPSIGLYTAGKNSTSVSCTISADFVNCTSSTVTQSVDMSPASGSQANVALTIGQVGSDYIPEAILTIPFENGVGLNGSCFGTMLGSDYIRTSIGSLSIVGVNNNFVKLEASIELVSTSYSGLAPNNVVISQPTPVSGINKMHFHWEGCDNTMYQLQLMKMYNIDNAMTAEDDIIVNRDDYHYTNNRHGWYEAYTINVNGNNKDLTLTEGTGYYIWRVRLINNTEPGGDGNPNNWGPWSDMYTGFSTTSTDISINSTTVSTEPSIFYYDQFDNDRNWIYNQSFIEGTSLFNNDLKETIISEGIKYTNGLGMLKQSQGFNNENNEILVNETFQDYVGRDALQSLTAPVENSFLGFVNNLNDGYDPSNFDTDAKYLNPDPFPSNSIIAQYYSDANTTDLGVPNADDFAFSRTRFNRSSLNQIRESCLAGSVLTINSTNSRTNRFLTGDVAEIELVRVFGSEAPNPKSVMKNITIDANNSVSVSYVDKEGKVLATCLSIPEGNNLEPLPSAAAAGTFELEYQLIGGIPSGSNSYELVRSCEIALSKSTILKFTYELEQKKLKYLCETKCKTCDYEVTFTVVNEEDPNTPVWENSVSIDPNVACSSLVTGLDVIPFTNATNTETSSLPPGVYIVTKTVKFHNTNPSTGLLYIDEFADDLMTTIDNSVYSTSADWVVCDGVGSPITGLSQISIADLNDKLVNKVMVGPVGVYAMLDINTTSATPVTRILKKDPLVEDGVSPCDLEITLNITPCVETVCPDPSDFADDLVADLVSKVTDYNIANPTCLAPTSYGDYFTIYNEVYKFYNSGNNLQLTDAEMKDVIKNMIHDYNNMSCSEDVGKNYSCENIKHAWDNALDMYLANVLNACQNPTSPSSQMPNDFLDLFFSWVGYRLVGSTDVAGTSPSVIGYKTHPYRCIFFPSGMASPATLATWCAANSATTLASVIINGNSVYNATNPTGCSDLSLPSSLTDYGNYFDPNFNMLDPCALSSCDKDENCIRTFYNSIRYPLSSSMLSAFGFSSSIDYEEIVSLTQQNERLCRQICQDKHDALEDAITTEFLSPDQDPSAVGLVESKNGTPLGYPLGSGSNEPTLPARDNVSINWLETYTQMAVEHCKSKCSLTVQTTGTCPGSGCVVTAVGTPDEQAEFLKATTMNAKVYLSAAFDEVNTSTTMPDNEYWMSLYNDACEACKDMDGSPLIYDYECDETAVTNNTIGFGTLPNIDGFLYKSCCPTLDEDHPYASYPMEHIDYDRPIDKPHVIAFSPDRETGVAYDLMPWLTRKLNEKILAGPAISNYNIYDIVYNYVNPVSDMLTGSTLSSSDIAHTFHADNNSTLYEQLKSDVGMGGHKRIIPLNTYGFEVMVGTKVQTTSTYTLSSGVFTIKRTQSSQLAMHGYMKVKVEIVPPSGFTGTADIMYKEKLLDYTPVPFVNKVFFISDNPKKDNTTSNEIVVSKSFSSLNTAPLVLEYLVRIKKHNYSPFETNEITNADIYAITTTPVASQPEYPVQYSEGSIQENGGGFSSIGYNEVAIPILRIYDPNIQPQNQTPASFNATDYEDDIQNAYTVSSTAITANNTPPEMTVNKHVQVVAISYYYNEPVRDDLGNIIFDAYGLPTVTPESLYLWQYFNNHKVFQPASICIQYIPPQYPDGFDQLAPTSCNDVLANDLLSSLSTQIQDFKDEKALELKNKYNEICGENGLNDLFSIKYDEGYHHYTLFYYNRAGNLIRTVAPEGVASVSKATSRSTVQTYNQASKYDYNSLNQVIKSRTQDAGETQFLYDDLGRLRFSQNAKQAAASPYPKCSYIKYDNLGRMIETGEYTWNSSATLIAAMGSSVNTPSAPTTYTQINDIVQTYYTTPYINYITTSAINYLGTLTPQQNLLNRVSYTISGRDPATMNSGGGVINVFSYDLQGNAIWTAQKILDMPFNFMRYEFDYLSGAVLKTIYNEGAVDAFYHRYVYDGNKNLLRTETSRDGYQWDKDATYAYYRHGPLKNTVIGTDKVQSIDYAYTINGWLKAINHPSLDKAKNHNYNSNIDMDDVFATKLQYFPDDFTRNGSHYNFTETGSGAYNYTPSTAHDLYNGNISAILTSNVSSLQTVTADLGVRFHVNDYKYDELNRLRTVEYGTRNSTTGVYSLMGNNSYKEDFTFDANGNILTAYRYDYSTGTPKKIDDFSYSYSNSPNLTLNANANSSTTPSNNRLDALSDAGVDVTGYTDIKAAGTQNYTYDPIGNLIGDSDEGLAVYWNVAGKVEKIEKTVSSVTTTIAYYYDAFGNRVAKSTQVGTANPTWDYYSRDVQGNTMADYSRTAGSSPVVTTTNQPLYGSLRLGSLSRNVQYFSGSSTTLATQTFPDMATISSYITQRKIGEKGYEINDHLGNVRNIFSDARLSTVTVGGISPSYTYTFSTYIPEDKAIYNYYAFGMLKTSANDYKEATSFAYKFGFNTQEKVNEIAGNGNHNTALYWEYDTRLGRRWNLDPVYTASESRYVVNGDNPIFYADPFGDFKTKGEARLYSLLHGRGWNDVEKNSHGEWASTGGGNIYDWSKQEKAQIANIIAKYTEAFNHQDKFDNWYLLNKNNFDNRLDAWKTWRNYAGQYKGESSEDRLARISAAFSYEARREYSSGGMNMYGWNGASLKLPSIISFYKSFNAVKGVGSFFQGGRMAKASELVGYAKKQGWKAMQSSGGPLKYVDANGVIRMTIKQGSQRAPGSGFPHVELRNALGKRIDAFGNEVTRKSLGNHIEILYDLK